MRFYLKKMDSFKNKWLNNVKTGLKATRSFVWSELVHKRDRWRACEHDSATEHTSFGDYIKRLKQSSEFQ